MFGKITAELKTSNLISKITSIKDISGKFQKKGLDNPQTVLCHVYMTKITGFHLDNFILLFVQLSCWSLLACSAVSEQKTRPHAESVQLYYNNSENGDNSVDMYVGGQGFNVDIFRNSSCDNKNAFVIEDDYKMSLTPLIRGNPSPVQPASPEWLGHQLLVSSLSERPEPDKYELAIEDPFGKKTKLKLVIMGEKTSTDDDTATGSEIDSGKDTDTTPDADSGTVTESDSKDSVASDSHSETDTAEGIGSNTSSTSPPDSETVSDQDTAFDTGRELSLCEQARKKDPTLVCCPTPLPPTCGLAWPEEYDKATGCCTHDLQIAFTCHNDFWLLPEPCITGSCGPPQGLIVYHHCSVNHCGFPKNLSSLAATTAIHWGDYKNTFSATLGDNCGSGYRDVWFWVPLPLAGSLEVYLLSGDDVHIQQINSCASTKCTQSVKSPQHLLISRKGTEQGALILISQDEDAPDGASVIRFQQSYK